MWLGFKLLFPGCSNKVGSLFALVWKYSCWITSAYLTLVWYWEERNEMVYWIWWKNTKKGRIWQKSDNIGVQFPLLQTDFSWFICLKMRANSLFLHPFVSLESQKWRMSLLLPNKNWPQKVEIMTRSLLVKMDDIAGKSVFLWDLVVHLTMSL